MKRKIGMSLGDCAAIELRALALEYVSRPEFAGGLPGASLATAGYLELSGSARCRSGYSLETYSGRGLEVETRTSCRPLVNTPEPEPGYPDLALDVGYRATLDGRAILPRPLSRSARDVVGMLATCSRYDQRPSGDPAFLMSTAVGLLCLRPLDPESASRAVRAFGPPSRSTPFSRMLVTLEESWEVNPAAESIVRRAGVVPVPLGRDFADWVEVGRAGVVPVPLGRDFADWVEVGRFLEPARPAPDTFVDVIHARDPVFTAEDMAQLARDAEAEGEA